MHGSCQLRILAMIILTFSGSCIRHLNAICCIATKALHFRCRGRELTLVWQISGTLLPAVCSPGRPLNRCLTTAHERHDRMAIPSSYKAAGLIAGGFAAWFIFGTLFRDNVVAEAAPEKKLFSVVTTDIKPARHGAELVMRGRTQATRKVTVRAETPGQVIATPAEEGSFIEKGSVLCELSIDSRSANVDQANAAVAKARIDYNAAQKLSAEGFQSAAAVATAKAALDAAEAGLKQARLDIGKTRIRAPFSGTLDATHAEAGDLLSIGAPCATLAELDPLKIVGAVSEKEIGRVQRGDHAQITLATGEAFTAEVTIIGAASANATRTFRVELTTKNPGHVKDGITANATILVGDTGGYLVPRNALVISDDGVTGIRIAEPSKSADHADQVTVRFVSVTLLTDTAAGVWIELLDESLNNRSLQLITRGQNYVMPGQMVIAVPRTAQES